jgi:DNA-binding MarR family transcriptional regulator
LQQLFKTTMRIIKEYIRQKSLGHLSSCVHGLIKKSFQQNLVDTGIDLKVELFPIVNRLFEEDQVPQQTIANWFSCDRHRMSRNLDELENAGFIERKNDPSSRRTNLICLTEYAKSNKIIIQNAILQVFDKAYTGFSKEEVETTIASLEKIINNLN